MHYVLEGTVRSGTAKADKDRGRVRRDAAVGPCRRRRARCGPMATTGEIEDVFAVQVGHREAGDRRALRSLAAGRRRAIAIPRCARRTTSRPTTPTCGESTSAIRSIRPLADPELAAAMFERAVGLDPEFAVAYAQLARVHELDEASGAGRVGSRQGRGGHPGSPAAGAGFGRRSPERGLVLLLGSSRLPERRGALQYRAIALRPSDSYAYMGFDRRVR